MDTIAAEDVIDPNTGEVLVEKDGPISRELAAVIEDAGVQSVLVFSKNEDEEEKVTKVIGNNFVDPAKYIDFDLTPYKLSEKVFYPVLMEIIEQAEGDEDKLKAAIANRRRELSPKHIILEDIVASVSYLINLAHGIGETDDIDHLSNRRLK